MLSISLEEAPRWLNDNIMRPARFDPDTLQRLFERRQIASLPELKSALGTEVAMTVFRKLAALSYLSSYSHRGAYYTLPSIARFDEQGLWSCRDVWFSRHGTLLDTLVAWVTEAPAGYFASELEAFLRVPVKDPLRTLVERGRLSRHTLGERWLYCASDRTRQREQRLARSAQIETFPLAPVSGLTVTQTEELKAAVVLFYSLLDEQQRRLFAGLESFKYGHGGDTLLAGLLGLDPDTVARGRRELLSGEVQHERIRVAGGGRPRAEKKPRTS
jgi:hypothetical protein